MATVDPFPAFLVEESDRSKAFMAWKPRSKNALLGNEMLITVVVIPHSQTRNGGLYMEITIDVLYSPLCPRGLAESRKIASDFNVRLIEYDPSLIDDEELPLMPEHIRRAIEPARMGRGGMLTYGYTFVNGNEYQWLPWANPEKEIRREVALLLASKGEGMSSHAVGGSISYRAITKKDVHSGLIGPSSCRGIEGEKQCEAFWTRISCARAPGVLALDGVRLAGSIVLMPKRAARRILFLTAPTDDVIDGTVVVAQLFVEESPTKREVANRLVAMAIEQARDAGCARIEAAASNRLGQKAEPYLSNAFEIEVLDSGEPLHCQVLARRL